MTLVLFLSACGGGGDEQAGTISADVDANTVATIGSDAVAIRDADGGENSDDAVAPDGSVQDETAADDTAADDTPSDGTAVDADAVGSKLLARVSDATFDASTGRFDGRLKVTGLSEAGAPESMSLSLTGSYDVDAQAADLQVDLSGLTDMALDGASAEEADMFVALFADPVQFRAIGDTVWLKWPMLGSMFGATLPDGSTAWIEGQLDDAELFATNVGPESVASPTDLLETLSDLDAVIEDRGREAIRGVDTTHYRVLIDLEAAAATLPADERAELEAELPGGLSGVLPIDVWMDDADLLRRLVVDFQDFDALGIGSDPGDLTSFMVEFELYDVGEPVAIGAPSQDQIITAEELGFDLGDNGF